MPLMLMSNPGLHLALLGNPRRAKKSKKRRGRKARFGFPSRKRFTQARWRALRRVGRRYRIKGGSAYRVRSVKVGVKRRSRRKTHLSGISWSGRLGGVRYRGAIRRRGSRKYRRAAWTNPRRRRTRTRNNPMKAIRGYVSALKSAPKDILGIFKGPKKIKHIAFAAGGAIGTYMAGGLFTARVLVPVLGKVGAASFMDNPTAKRVVGGLVPFSLGYAASRFVKGDIGKALLVGGALASLVEIIQPGMIGTLITRTPVVATVAAAVPAPATTGPVSGMYGLGAYVDSPAYQGVGAYVDSPAYQGVGAYVDSPAYQGVGENDDEDELAGVPEMAGMGDYLTQGDKYMDSYLAN